ncbi:alpha,alpha-trehalose-phosphate synthase (UDP-forming) [Salinilacihabitans rarus]|uniref:alpha,alpha-trehalose-phosphate synthase (UDP-forming) n=1 Tax=Salinilacihabitans rarus TaxID=2961596 RepID=UPI0020C86535|nr:trehalose-6-phosphate synthase [Salinilacihabitans rarus]
MRFTEERSSSTEWRGTETRYEERDRGREADPGGDGPESLIVVSNRQPYRHEYADGETAGGGEDGEADEKRIVVDEPTGGLTAGLDPVLCETNGTWIAWGDGDADRDVVDEDDCVAVPPGDGEYTLRRIWLSESVVEGYYYGFSNRVLWPLCHGFPDLIEHRAGDLERYRRANGRFADAVAEHASPDDAVWLQDYHLGFAPAMIRESVPASTTVAQFWHIPWPSPTTFRGCPAAVELLRGLLGNDLLGFHVDRYVEAFLDCVDRFLPEANVDPGRGTVRYRDHETRVVSTPMGVDAAAHDRQSRAVDPSRWEAIRERYDVPADTAVGLGVDRLDYTKGIPERLAAIERLFERYPDWRGRFTFLQKATPSRTDVPAYRRLGEHVRAEVDRINDRFATDDWRPIVYTEDHLPREELCALYRRADVMVVSPLCDGMNLVAQEFAAASVDGDGALVLSERVGASDTLGEFAYTVDPTAIDPFAETVADALAASEPERRRRMRGLRERVFEFDLGWWMDRQFDHIRRIHAGERAGVDDAGHTSPSV